MVDKPTYEELEKRIKELEEQVLECKNVEEELQTILDVVPVIIFQKDIDGKAIRTSQAFNDILELSKGEVIGKTTAELFPKYGEDMMKDDQEVMESGKPKLNIVERYDSPEGVRWARTGKAPLRNDKGNVTGIIGYSADITEQKQIEKELEKKTHDLGERVKELSCLYGISKITEVPSISLDDIIQGIVNLIPSSWQYPEITCSRILFHGKEYKTKNFNESKWKQSNGIFVNGAQEGVLDVFYTEEMPEEDEGPFLKEERYLINVITERLGHTIERNRAEEEKNQLILKLQKAIAEVKTLKGILPICSYCKKIRDDKGYWNQVDAYILKYSEADLSHGICPECAKKHFPDINPYKDST